MLKSIAMRRKMRLLRLANVDRPDKSYDDLTRFKDEGYTQVKFVQNYATDADCAKWDGQIWDIDDLLAMDPVQHYVIFWITHPNCLCHFEPYGKSTKQQIQPLQQPNQLGQPQRPIQQPQFIPKKEIPPMTIKPAPKV